MDKSPEIVVVDADPAPIVASTWPSVACSPSSIKPAVNCEDVPLLSATNNDNLPASSVSSASDTSATIFANDVCSWAALSPINSIVPISSPSAPAAPLSLIKCNREPFASFVVFLIITNGSSWLAELNVTVSVSIVISVLAFKSIVGAVRVTVVPANSAVPSAVIDILAAAPASSVVAIVKAPCSATVIVAVSSVDPVIVITFPSIATSSTFNAVVVIDELKLAAPASLISNVKAVISLPPSLPFINKSLSEINVFIVISSLDSVILNSFPSVPNIILFDVIEELNIAAPASLISNVNAVISEPPSLPLKIISVSFPWASKVIFPDDVTIFTAASPAVISSAALEPPPPPPPAIDVPLVIWISFPASVVKYNSLGVPVFTHNCP